MKKKIASSRIRGFQSCLLRWYRNCGRNMPWRRPGESPYRLIVTEFLLQRTHAERVASIYSSFFNRYPSWVSLANAQRPDLVSILKPLGLWRRRVDVIKNLANAIHARRGRLPSARQEIENLPGVGQYIANSIELIRWNVPRPLLDVNMSRVLERYFGPRKLADIRHDPFLQDLAQEVVSSTNEALLLNWAVLDLGALVCTVRDPRCHSCPLQAGCIIVNPPTNRDASMKEPSG